MDITKYLTRIDIDTAGKPSFELLSILQQKHLLNIPFEDLDIPNRNRIVLDLEKIYNKIIPTKRGGFCYELNGLFHWLLKSIGFNVDMLSAKVFNSTTKELGPEFDHMTLLAHLDKDYLVDVGFGDSFRKPLEMPEEESSDISGSYRLKRRNNNEYELQKLENSLWQLQYVFTRTKRNLRDFKKMCDFQQDSPDSHFRTRNLCTIATPAGRITLSEKSLTITENGEKLKSEIASEKEFFELLEKYFGITLQ